MSRAEQAIGSTARKVSRARGARQRCELRPEQWEIMVRVQAHGTCTHDGVTRCFSTPYMCVKIPYMTYMDICVSR